MRFPFRPVFGARQSTANTGLQITYQTCPKPYHNLLLEFPDPPHVFQSPSGYIGAAVEGPRKGRSFWRLDKVCKYHAASIPRHQNNLVRNHRAERRRRNDPSEHVSQCVERPYTNIIINVSTSSVFPLMKDTPFAIRFV